MTDSVYWIWFQLVFGIGTRRAGQLLACIASPQELFDGVSNHTAAAVMLEQDELEQDELEAAAPAMEEAVRIQRRTLRKGCRIVTPDHPDYPPLLGEISSPPAALYVKGDLACLKDTLAIAMVGSRKHTEYGAMASALLAEGLVRSGVVVVSGLAPGIDTECHRAALAAGGKTVGVLGCGIDVDYPKGSRELKTAASKNGAVVTEFPLGQTPHRGNFPLRNRIISGMCHGTVVVEADANSGSLITARLAREQGRDVFAVPGSIFQDSRIGAHKLMKEGALVAECAEDVLSVYPQSLRRDPVNARGAVKGEAVRSPMEPTPPDGAGDVAVLVYGLFSMDTITVDDIVSDTGLATGEILAALTELELYGLIKSHPGRRFGLCES